MDLTLLQDLCSTGKALNEIFLNFVQLSLCTVHINMKNFGRISYFIFLKNRFILQSNFFKYLFRNKTKE